MTRPRCRRVPGAGRLLTTVVVVFCLVTVPPNLFSSEGWRADGYAYAGVALLVLVRALWMGIYVTASGVTVVSWFTTR